MRLRLTPRDTSFYDHFTAAAVNLVEGAHLLREMLTEGADRPLRAKKIRDVEHRSDEVKRPADIGRRDCGCCGRTRQRADSTRRSVAH